MTLHENMKNAKIMEEAFAYFLEKGIKEIQSSLLVSEKETIFTIIIKTKDTKLFDQFKQDMVCCRDEELEEYGWELMGDETCVCELRTLGMYIDNYDSKYEDGVCEIILHRKK